MKKFAFITQMTYDVSQAEKKQAEQALLIFDDALRLLKISKNYLDTMGVPFKENPNSSKEEILAARSVIRRFRDKSVDNFNAFKKVCFKCINAMKTFSSDTQTIVLMKSFIALIEELESNVNKFVDCFNELDSVDFVKNITSLIDKVKDQCNSIEESIEERIKDHIKNDILAKNWVNNVSDNLQMKIEKKMPLVMELHKQVEDKINQQKRNS